jgi:ribosomal protein S8
LYNEGLIQSFKINSEKKFINIKLRSYMHKNLFKINKFISVSKKINLSYNDISLLTTKNYTFFFSTDKGILTNYDCKKHKIGGKLLFVC